MTDTDKFIQTQSHKGEENRAIETANKPKRPKTGGRKKGSKNKATLLREAVADKFTGMASKGRNAEKVFEKLFEKAQEGDMAAIKLVLDKFVPNADRGNEQKVKDFGIQIVINDMKEPEISEKVIEHDNADA